MDHVLRVIQLLVAPAVMISADGLICLALYSRLAAIVSRLRTFHKERFDAQSQLSSLPLEEQTSGQARRLRARSDALDQQARLILRRARLIRAALICLLVCVICMLACSLSLAVTVLSNDLAWVPLLLFFNGAAAMAVGCVLAIIELRGALEPVTNEGFTIGEPQNP
jgi:hypothetical protein